MLLALLPAALANGQTSHQWITVHAIDLVPPGDLADFLARDDVRDALLNGTMFPDGGYAVDDDYGEMAHWEPLQDDYLDWIRAQWPSPEDDPTGAQHLAFLLGLRSHGMADQFYDATFMERSKAWDPAESWSCCSMDEATDVCLAAEAGPGTVPPKWWPEELVPMFAADGHEVDADLIDQGQSLLGIAIAYVGAVSDEADTVADYDAQFPWACENQFTEDVIGNPPHEAEVVAAYWQVTWDRVHGGDGWELMASVPSDQGTQAVTDGEELDARLAVVFSRGLDPSTVQVSVTGPDGDIPVTASVFYGNASHVVNIDPEADWPIGARMTITVAAGLRTWDGTYTLDEPISTTFVTEAPSVPTQSTEACGCGGSSVAGVLVLGGLVRRRRRGRGPDGPP